MRNGLTLLLSLFTLLSSAQVKPIKQVTLPAKKYQNGLSKKHLRGKVKSMVDSVFEGKRIGDQVVKDTLMWYYIANYDKQGNNLNGTRYRYNGVMQTGWGDDEIVEDNGSAGSMYGCYSTSYEYNKKGYIIYEEGKSISGTRMWKDSIEYNNDGSFGKEIGQNEVGKMYIIYYYDSGHPVKEIHVDPYGKLIEKDTVTHNVDGFLVNTQYVYNDRDTNSTVLKYNFRGDLVEIDRNEGNEMRHLNSKESLKYDDKGHLTEDIRYREDGREISNEGYVYDGIGNRIERDSYSKQGKVIWKATYNYEYNDEAGNWTKLTINSDGRLKIITRHFEYYK